MKTENCDEKLYMNTKVHLRLTSLLVNVSLSILLCLLEGYLRKGETITVKYIHT